MGKVIPFRKREDTKLENTGISEDLSARIQRLKHSIERLNELMAELSPQKPNRIEIVDKGEK